MKNFKFYVLNVPPILWKRGDTIQWRTLYKGGHYLRKYGIHKPICTLLDLIFENFWRIWQFKSFSLSFRLSPNEKSWSSVFEISWNWSLLFPLIITLSNAHSFTLQICTKLGYFWQAELKQQAFLRQLTCFWLTCTDMQTKK